MASSIKDPAGAEPRALAQVVDFTGRRVLEVGCGDGRMVWLYAPRAASVLGIDEDAEAIAEARRSTPPELKSHVRFRVARAERVRLRPASFDIAFLAWSL
jgi:ubiquinone/menaquinone biosynthesis C-methylase UbiE